MARQIRLQMQRNCMRTSDHLIHTTFKTGRLPNLAHDHFIAGAWVAADSRNRMESLSSGKTLAEAQGEVPLVS